MNLLTLKAKVKLVSEEDLEVEDLDLGIIAKSKEWVWRQVAVLVEEIYKIISFSSSKSIVQLYDGEKILVAEPFETLSARWQESIKEVESDEEVGEEWPTYNQDGETFSEDEE